MMKNPNHFVQFTALFLFTCLSTQIHAAGVDSFSPVGEIKKVRQVAVRFSEQMVAFGDPREVAPFDISCPTPGRGRWADQRNWIYDFEYDLPAGVSCIFTTRNKLVSLDGQSVTKSSYAFNTGGPAIMQSEPYEGSEYVDENQIFILGLDAPATAESVQKHASCQAEGIQEQIPVRLVLGKQRKAILDTREAFLTRYYSAILKSRNGSAHPITLSVDDRGSDREKFLKSQDGLNSSIVVLQCQHLLPNTAHVSLVWGKGITSVSGIPTSQTQTFAYRTRPLFEAKFSCDRVNENAGCIPVLPMRLGFSAPVSATEAYKIRLIANNGKSVQPVVTEADKKEQFIQYITFPTPLPQNTQFKIKLPDDLRDDAGRSLSNASSFPLAVHTDEHPPLAKFAARFGILELNASTNAPPLLPLTLRNVEATLPANLAKFGQDIAPINGKVLHGDSEMTALTWLHRLNLADSSYDLETEQYSPDHKPGMTSIFGKNTALKPLSIPKPLGGKAFEVVGIPLAEPGFYVVEIESPRLGEALLGEKRPYYAHAAALVTNLSVHFKQGRESSLIWVTSLDKGAPVANASVAVRNCKGDIYFEGRTDEQGIARIARGLPSPSTNCNNQYDNAYFVSARLNQDFSFVLSTWDEGIALWRFNAYQGQWESHDIVHAVMDRTLLRAGETVHMKLFARRKTAPGFAQAPASQPSSITIMHQGSEEKYTLPVSWNGHGTATLDWHIPPDAKQGSYLVQTPAEAGTFQVESFRIPTMKAIIEPADKQWVHASQAVLNIQVNYLSGGGASFLPVKMRGQLQPKYVTFDDYEDFTFANGSVPTGIQKENREPWYEGAYELSEADEDAAPQHPGDPARKLLATQSLHLDAAGAGQAIFSKLSPSDAPQEIQAELEYRDPNGEILTAARRVSLWPSQLIVGIKPEGWMATAEHLRFHALALDLQGHPRPGVKISVNGLQREYFSHRRRLIGGFYAYDNHSEVKAVGELCQGITDNKGLLICDVKSPVKGNVILQAAAIDATGNASIANREIWVAGNDDWWFDASDNDRIDLLPEKKRYEPDEKARFQVRMPFKEANVLVTVEREGVMESFVTHLTRDNPTIEVPIKGNYAPNVFVSAFAVRGRINTVQPTALIDLGKPAFKMGLAEIRVGWAAHELKVKVATDKAVYHVRDKAKVSVDVRRNDGSIPSANSEVILVAVDEGLLELKPNRSWALLDAMMQRRGIEVATSTAQMQVIGKRHFGRKAVAAGGGGGAGKSARELFDTLLFWQARVKLDEHGHAEAEIPLNDSLTSFRIVAIASNEMTSFGTGATSIQSTQDLMLISGLPPLVREADRFHAGFTVRNASKHPIEATLSAKLDGYAGELHPIAITLPPGEARDMGWDITAPLDRSALKWEVSIREKGMNEDGDRLKVSQKIIPAVPVRTLQATIMQLEKPETVNVKLPEGAIPGRGGINVTFHKQLGGNMPGVQEYMSRYPYSCLEQQASKAIALQDENRWNDLMNILPSYLDRDGLVKYFPAMWEGDDTLTSYLLAIAHEAGYTIPDDIHNRMRRGLTGFVEGRVIRYSALPTADLSIRKVAAIEALSRGGEVNGRWLDSISIEPNLWPTSAVLDWLSILQRTPGISTQSGRLAEDAQQIIRSRLNFQGSTMGFSTERNDALWWLMINGDVNANRALLILLDRDGWRPDIPRLVQGTLGRQLQGRWNTTIANAWGVLAIKKFSAKFESAPVSGTSTASVSGEQFQAEWGNETGKDSKLLNWPPAVAPLNLSHSGSGKPWAIMQSLAALPLKQPLFTGYRINRQVIPVEKKDAKTWHKGDVVRIHLDIDAQSDMTWVVINDPIPAGAAILGTGLGGDSKILTRDEKKQGWVWPAFEERTFDSFRAYYRLVPKGKFSVEYTMRLNNDGNFQLPPTRVEAMYAPEMFGELPNDNLNIIH